MRTIRSILAVLAGCFAAGLTAAMIEGLGHAIFPPPPGVDLTDPAALAKIMDQIPLGAIVGVLLGWLAGTTIGAATAAWLSPGHPLIHGLIVGGVMLACGIATMLTIPHPLWFWIATLVLTPTVALLGSKDGAAVRHRAKGGAETQT